MTYRRYKRIDWGVRIAVVVGIALVFIYGSRADWEITFPCALGLAVAFMLARSVAKWRLPRDS